MALSQKFFDYMTKYQPNPIVWVMLIQAGVFYLGHAAINYLAPNTQMLLFDGMVSYAPIVPVVWGLIGLLSIVIEFVGVTTDSRILTRVFASMQVALWTFAGYVYIDGGLFMLAAAVAIPQFLFWAWNLAVRYDHDRVVDEVRRTLTGRG